MFVRWNFTVCGATQNSFAISSFESPRARAPRIVSSRSVRPSAFALARYNPNGSRDPTFDGDGSVVTNFGGGDFGPFGVAIQTDGKIVAAGDSALARTNNAGKRAAQLAVIGSGAMASTRRTRPLAACSSAVAAC